MSRNSLLEKEISQKKDKKSIVDFDTKKQFRFLKIETFIAARLSKMLDINKS